MGAAATTETPILEARNLVQEFVLRDSRGVKSGVVHAVSDVTFHVQPGEALGIVGETGSGKTTLVRCLFGAPPPKSGSVLLQGVDLTKLKGKRLLKTRQTMQMVFQDPFGSLDPKWKVRDIVEEGLVSYRMGDATERRKRVDNVLDRVGLDPGVYADRRPRQLSGGQCQRVAIARALAVFPEILVCDEAVSSLDVLIQAQVLKLFEDLRRDLRISFVMIAHDLAVVKQVSDRVAVMYLGKLAEIGPSEALYRQPLHPYTAALLASIPRLDPDAPRVGTKGAISGQPPSPVDPPPGCRFHTRCPRAQERCRVEEPVMRMLAPAHAVACHFPLSGSP
jgi:oligopeptide/dipeptide ABC transporter ATP-binding protein